MSDNLDMNQEKNVVDETNATTPASIYSADYVDNTPKKAVEPLVGIPEADKFGYTEPKNALQRFREKHALGCALIVFAVVLAIMLLSQLLSGLAIGIYYAATGKDELNITENYVAMAISELIPLTVGIVLANVLGIANIFKEKKKSFGAGLVPGLYILIVGAINAVIQCGSIISTGNYRWGNPVNVLVSLILCALVGFAEEIVFRGVIGEIIYRKYANSGLGIWFAAIMTSVLFGGIHLVNISAGASVIGVIVQVVAVVAEGLLFTAVYFRTRNIYVAAFLHGFLDFCAFLPITIFDTGDNLVSTIGSYSPMMLVGMIPYIGVSCLIFRNPKLREMLGRTDIRADKATKNRFRITVIIVGVILLGFWCWGFVDYMKYIYEMVMEATPDLMNGIGL